MAQCLQGPSFFLSLQSTFLTTGFILRLLCLWIPRWLPQLWRACAVMFMPAGIKAPLFQHSLHRCRGSLRPARLRPGCMVSVLRTLKTPKWKTGLQGREKMDIWEAVNQSSLQVMIEFNPHYTLLTLAQLLPPFTGRGTRVQRDRVICWSSHKFTTEAGQPDSKTCSSDHSIALVSGSFL